MLPFFRGHLGKNFLTFGLGFLRRDVLVDHVFNFEGCFTVHIDILLGNGFSKLAFEFYVVLADCSYL